MRDLMARAPPLEEAIPPRSPAPLRTMGLTGRKQQDSRWMGKTVEMLLAMAKHTCSNGLASVSLPLYPSSIPPPSLSSVRGVDWCLVPLVRGVDCCLVPLMTTRMVILLGHSETLLGHSETLLIADG